jgi:hypothetical protein
VAKGGVPEKLFIKTHLILNTISKWETIQVVSNGQWLKASEKGNELVDNESDATKFQTLGVGSHYVFQTFDFNDLTTSYQLGIDVKAIDNHLTLIKDAGFNLWKLVPA